MPHSECYLKRLLPPQTSSYYSLCSRQNLPSHLVGLPICANDSIYSLLAILEATVVYRKIKPGRQVNYDSKQAQLLRRTGSLCAKEQCVCVPNRLYFEREDCSTLSKEPVGGHKGTSYADRAKDTMRDDRKAAQAS